MKKFLAILMAAIMALSMVSIASADPGTYDITVWCPEEAVELTADMGFRCLEVACWPAGKAERRYAGVSHIDAQKVTKAILPSKDADAFHPQNVGLSRLGEPAFMPCTPSGVIRLLDEYGVEISGKRCVVIGRSNIVGKPVADMLLARNGTVTVCHSKTPDIAEYTKNADIIVVAVGRAKMLKGDMIKEGCAVIDVGINRVDGKLCGDCDFDSCAEKAAYITPVPGGVGPMTIAMLLENTMRAYDLK